MASAPYVLSLPLRAPGPDQKSHVLVNITPRVPDTDPDGHASSAPLDLELVATDDYRAYVLPLKQKHLTKYKHDGSACSDSEWQACLEGLLLDSQPIKDVKAYALTPGDGNWMFIHVEKKVSGRTEALGALKLPRKKSAEETIDMFDWSVALTKNRDNLEREIADLQQRHDQLQERVAEETAHFKELEQAKRQFEADHDSWLKDLLNEKKLKIRMQEQVLATANVDPARLDAIAARSASQRRNAAGSSRKGKRKAETFDLNADADLDDGVDKMDVDVPSNADSHSGSLSGDDRKTPSSDAETASASEPEPEPQLESEPASESEKPAGKGARTSSGLPRRNMRERKKSASSLGSEDDSAPKARLSSGKGKSARGFDPDESTASE